VIVRIRSLAKVCYSFVLLFLLSPSPLFADDKGVTIHVTLKLFLEKIRPVPAYVNIVTLDGTLVLADQSVVTEQYLIYDGQIERHGNSREILGKGDWRVVGAHSLERRDKDVQSVNVLRVTVTGHKCNVFLDSQLLPNYSEYTLTNFGVGSDIFFNKPKLLSSTCSIS
jgi:hypothetical protein